MGRSPGSGRGRAVLLLRRRLLRRRLLGGRLRAEVRLEHLGGGGDAGQDVVLVQDQHVLALELDLGPAVLE